MASYGLSAGLGGGAFLTHGKAALLAVFSKVQRSTQRAVLGIAVILRRDCAAAKLCEIASLAQESFQRSVIVLGSAKKIQEHNKPQTKPADLF